MTRLLLTSMRSITVLVICVLLLTGCSSLIIHDDDNIAVVATKVTVRTVNCALTFFMGCASEWIWMEDAKAQSMVWVGRGDINGDSYKCQQEASSSSSGAPGYVYMPMGKNAMILPMDSGGGREINQQLYHSCMRAHGYALMDQYEYNKGSHCAASNATIGTRLKSPNGKMMKVKTVYGNSPRCSDPATPILVDVEDVGKQQGGQSSGHAPVSPPIDISAEDLQTLNTQAAQGNDGAQNHLGWLYVEGQGVPQDYAKARQWLEQAGAQGNADAQTSLGALYANGRGVPQDYAKARQWWEQAAAQGYARAQYNLGKLYVNGQGVPQDYAKARQWWEQAAAQGIAEAQTNLGRLYHDGQGVPQDYGKARQWYEQAAAQGYAQAQTNLGWLYDNGKGVPQDYATARGWYEKAAAQGEVAAQYNLGKLYVNGQGVPQDDVRAYMWYSLAASHLTGDGQKLAGGNRDGVARRMTPAQIAEAQRLAQQCQARQFKGC